MMADESSFSEDTYSYTLRLLPFMQSPSTILTRYRVIESESIIR